VKDVLRLDGVGDVRIFARAIMQCGSGSIRQGRGAQSDAARLSPPFRRRMSSRLGRLNSRDASLAPFS